MALPSVNMLRQEAISRNLTGSAADAFVFGTLNKLRGTANKTPAKQRIQPYVSSGIAGIRKGKKVSLKSLMNSGSPTGV
jgi:hypothetical protein